MKLSKQNLQSKLNTWVKHVNRGDSKFFFEVNAYTGVTEENFIRELKWLFNDPQDAEERAERNPYRREIFFYPDGTIHRFIRVYGDGTVCRVSFDEYVRTGGKNMRISGPTYKVGLSILDSIDLISDEEKQDVLKKAKAYRLTAKKWM
jgi:hypothetical protein